MRSSDRKIYHRLAPRSMPDATASMRTPKARSSKFAPLCLVDRLFHRVTGRLSPKPPGPERRLRRCAREVTEDVEVVGHSGPRHLTPDLRSRRHDAVVRAHARRSLECATKRLLRVLAR